MNTAKHAMGQVTIAVRLAQTITIDSQMLIHVTLIALPARSSMRKKTYAKKALRPYALSLAIKFWVQRFTL